MAGGGQVGNQSRTIHGGRASGRFGMPLSALKAHPTVWQSLKQFRRALEDAVMGKLGKIDLARRALISSAVRHEQVARLAERLIATHTLKDGGELIVSWARTAAWASNLRDQAIKRLGVADALGDGEGKPEDGWQPLDVPPLGSPGDDGDQDDGSQGLDQDDGTQGPGRAPGCDGAGQGSVEGQGQ